MSYSKIPIARFFLALLIVTIPIWVMERYDAEGLTWLYTFIILLGFILANDSGMGDFTTWVDTIIKKGK